jgi:hypothetical protein
MYIIIFEDGSIRLIKEIDDGCLSAFEDNMVDIIDPSELKILEEVVDGKLVWADIKQA